MMCPHFECPRFVTCAAWSSCQEWDRRRAEKILAHHDDADFTDEAHANEIRAVLYGQEYIEDDKEANIEAIGQIAERLWQIGLVKRDVMALCRLRVSGNPDPRYGDPAWDGISPQDVRKTVNAKIPVSVEDEWYV